MEAEDEAWYELLETGDTSVTQGDLLFDCIVPGDAIKNQKLATEDDEEKLVYSPKRINAVVMTQSCQFEQNKAANVTLCAFIPLEELATSLKQQGVKNDTIKSLVSNMQAGRHATMLMLDEYKVPNQYGYKHGFLVLLLDNIYTTPYGDVCETAERQEEPRLRLRTPYREYVNRAFGNQFSSIGLAKDIDRDATKELITALLKAESEKPQNNHN